MSNGSEKLRKSERVKNDITRISASILTGTLFGVKKKIGETEKMVKKLEKLEGSIRAKIDELTSKSYGYRQRGYDTTAVEERLNRSRMHVENMEFKEAASALKEAKEELKTIRYRPFPLLDRDIVLVTSVVPEGDSISYQLQLANREDEPTSKILIQPTVPRGFKDLPSKELKSVEPRCVESINFELIPTKDIEEGSLAHFLIDGKIKLASKMWLGIEERKNIIEITNISNRHIQDLRIRPMIPECVTSEFPYRDIDLLRSNQTRKVSFNLKPSE